MSEKESQDIRHGDTLSSEISVRYGNVEFSGKGEQEWLGAQFKAFIDAIPQGAFASSGHVVRQTDSSGASDETPAKFSVSLASHIKSKGASGNQTKRFLVTADWLRLKGKQKMLTTDVAKALTDNQQSRLANPADCLNKNVSKGYCEKSSEGFYITPEGLEELGYRDV